MPVRILVPVVLLALAVVAWLLWPQHAVAPPAPPGAGASAAAPGTAAPVAAARAPAAAVSGDESARRIEVPATAVWIVQGRAVRGVEQPAPGVKVLARAFHGTEAKGEPAIEAHLVAGLDGGFTWPLEPPAAITFLELAGEGERVRSYPETFVIAPGEPPPPSFDLWIMALDAVARGRVLDDKDQPIAGARVGSSWQDGVRTDEQGRFEVAVERKASVTVYANARGFVQLRQEVVIDVVKGEGEAELRLRAANRIHGRVTDSEHRPIAGATVRTFYTIYADAAETDADGRYLLDNLDPSLKSHSVFARKEGWVEGKAEVEASAPDVEQDLVLGRGIEVRGAVFAPDGQPVPAATVFLGSSPNAYDRLDAVTGADGRFAFDCVRAGEETLNVERRGFAGKRMKITVPKAPASPLELRVDLDAGHFVGGVATGQDGKPVAGVSIAPRLHDEYLDGIRGKTDEQGRFRLDGVPATGLDLEFYGGGVLRKNVPVAAVDRDDLAVELERHGSLAGTVVDGRTGEPIRDFRIRFGQPRLGAGETQGSGYSVQWLRGGEAFHDERGVFRIGEEVRVGSVFALEASAAGYGAAVNDHVGVRLDPDPAQTVFPLYPGVVVEGVVRERRTALGVAGVRLRAYAGGRPLRPDEPNDDEGRPTALSDERGAFRLENVGVGEVFIAAAHKDWLPVSHGPIAIAPGASVPPQEVILDHGATVTVTVRNADGTPMPDAELSLLAGGGIQFAGNTDAGGTARIERVGPGDHELALVLPSGPSKVWAFRRALHVEHEDCSVELVASDGDATVVVIVDAPEALPEGGQLLFLPAGTPATGRSGAFRARGVPLQAGRIVVQHLPAMELRVLLFCNEWSGSSTATAVAGQTVEVHLPAQKVQHGGR